MVKKRIVIGLLLLFGIIGFGLTYFATAKKNDSSQRTDVTVEVKRYGYSASDALQQEDSTGDFYEYEYQDDDTAVIEVERYEFGDSDALQQEDSTEDFYEYEYQDDDTAVIEVERYEFTD